MENICVTVEVLDLIESVEEHIKGNTEDNTMRDSLIELNKCLIGDFNVLEVGRVCYIFVFESISSQAPIIPRSPKTSSMH